MMEPAIMHAAVNTIYGAPDVVRITRVPKPSPASNALLVRVHASTVNRTDIGFRTGTPRFVRLFSGLRRPTRTILGCEFSGVVEAVGIDVRSFHPGDGVIGFTGMDFGGHAEYLCISAIGAVAHQPVGLTHQAAAPTLEGAHYALNDLRAAKLQKGQRILINGATGAIGSAAVQLAKHMGAHVTAVCDTARVELVRSLGADVVIDRHQLDFTSLGGTFDVVFDAVGKSSFGRCKPLLTRRGVYVSTELGHGYQNPFLALITPLFGGKKVLFPIPTLTQADVVFITSLVGSGVFKPVIDRHFPLARIADAHRYVDGGEKTGNVVITMD